MQTTIPPVSKQIMQKAYRVFYDPNCYRTFDDLNDLLKEGWEVKMVFENKGKWADYILEKEK